MSSARDDALVGISEKAETEAQVYSGSPAGSVTSRMPQAEAQTCQPAAETDDDKPQAQDEDEEEAFEAVAECVHEANDNASMKGEPAISIISGCSTHNL